MPVLLLWRGLKKRRLLARPALSLAAHLLVKSQEACLGSEQVPSATLGSDAIAAENHAEITAETQRSLSTRRSPKSVARCLPLSERQRELHARGVLRQTNAGASVVRAACENRGAAKHGGAGEPRGASVKP